jgi:hypothetical protein
MLIAVIRLRESQAGQKRFFCAKGEICDE